MTAYFSERRFYSGGFCARHEGDSARGGRKAVELLALLALPMHVIFRPETGIITRLSIDGTAAFP